MTMTDSGGGAVTSDERLVAVGSHLLGHFTKFIGPLVVFLVKRDSKFVQFHSLQAIFFQLALAVVYGILGSIWVLGWPFMVAVWIADLVLVIIACVRSYHGDWWEYPVVGAIARRQVGS